MKNSILSAVLCVFFCAACDGGGNSATGGVAGGGGESTGGSAGSTTSSSGGTTGAGGATGGVGGATGGMGGDTMPKPLECAQQSTIQDVPRGSENGLDRLLAIAEDNGDLVGVLLADSYVDFVRWPAAGGDPIRQNLAMNLTHPTSPSITVIGGTIHVTWADFMTGLYHAVSAPGGFVSEVVAPDASSGALVRGSADPEILWIDSMGLIHISTFANGAWSDVTTAGYGSASTSMEVIKDAGGHYHVAQNSSGDIGYVTDVTGEWFYNTVSLAPQNVYAGEVALTMTSNGDVLIAWARESYVQVERYNGGDNLGAKTLTQVGLDSALGVGLTTRGDTPWFVTATWPAGGPGVIYTPVIVGALPMAETKHVDDNAYTMSPAIRWIGDTLHVVWARAGFTGNSTIVHSTCQ